MLVAKEISPIRSRNLVLLVSPKLLPKNLRQNIRVNAVAPGPTNTKTNYKFGAQKLKVIMFEKVFSKRLNEPIDIANAFLFLASDLAEGITGEVLVVDGGYNLL